jgi:hypothetical protein
MTYMTLARLAIGLSLVGAACGGGDLTLPPGADSTQLEIVQGDDQTGAPGVRLPDPLIVRIVDLAGNGIANRTVLWVIKAGGGVITPVTGMTDAEGFASAEWTLGPVPGANVLEAQVPDIGTATFTSMATSGGGPAPPPPTPASIQLVEGDGQVASVGTPVAVPPAVRVLDQEGSPIAGVPVTFVVTAGGGSVEGTDQVTGADGTARVGRWVLGAAPGPNTLEARSGSLAGSPVVFTAQGTAVEEPQVDHLEFRVEPPATIERNESFHVEVRLVDANGALVPLSEIFIYLGLFPEGSDTPSNDDLNGERFENTVDGIAKFDLRVEKKGRYRLRALTDDLPELGPNGPEPFLFSRVFEVN